MKNFVLVRVDDRLIHGQVMTSWLNYTSATEIMIVDDETAQDDFLKMIVTSVAPANVQVSVFSIAEFIEAFPTLASQSPKTIILVKYPTTLVQLADANIIFPKINIGGMGAQGERKKFYKNISATTEERNIFQNLISQGSQIEIQIIAEDKAIDVKSLLK